MNLTTRLGERDRGGEKKEKREEVTGQEEGKVVETRENGKLMQQAW